MAFPDFGHHRRIRILCCWLVLASGWPTAAVAKSPPVPPPDLEQAIDSASLIVVARVAAVKEATVVLGGKSESVIRTFEFEPVAELKGIFARDVLALTSHDLGSPVWTPRAGELRLLLLARSEAGYYNVHRQPTLDQALPLITSTVDPLVKSVKLLIAITQEPDRRRKIGLLLEGSETARGPSAIPLLASLGYRALLAAQYPGTVDVTQHLADASPEVRMAAAQTLGDIMKVDYLRSDELAQQTVTRLVGLLEATDPAVSPRVAALQAIAVAASPALSDVVSGQLHRGLNRSTWAEQAALMQVIGRHGLNEFADRVFGVAGDLELDATDVYAEAVQAASIRLDPIRAARLIERRIGDKHAAGLDAALEVRLAGELPLDVAVAVLAAVPVDRLTDAERRAFAIACGEVGDGRLVSPLAQLLGPSRPGLHWHVAEALRRINTVESARALQPYLPQEVNIHRKLEIGEFLGLHGIDAGVPYALEHMSQPHLLESSIAVLRAAAGPEAVQTLRRIVTAGNDTEWTGAAIRALGALGDRQLAPGLPGMVEDLRHPLAPYALVALGQVGEPEAIETFRHAVRSRDDRIVVAGIRGAAALMQRGTMDDASLRDAMAGLLASADTSIEVRAAALDALRYLNDSRLDAALTAAAVDGRLEGEALLAEIEDLLQERKIALAAERGMAAR